MPPHNLPEKPFGRLVGRDDALQETMARLAPSSPHSIIPLVGSGGIGKTALALEIAYRCLEQRAHPPCADPPPAFNEVIWVSPAERALDTGQGPIGFARKSALDDVLVTIAEAFHAPHVIRMTRDRRIRAVRREIERHEPILLVVDGLETADDVDLLEFLQNSIPRNDRARRNKVIVTLAYAGDLPFPIPLTALSQEQTVMLMLQEARAQGIPMGHEDAVALSRLIRGIPMMAHWAVGSYHEHGLEGTLPMLEQTTDISSAFLRESVASIQQTHADAYRLLLALACFDEQTGASPDALTWVMRMEPDAYHDALDHLDHLGLVVRLSPQSPGSERVVLVPPAYRFLRAQIYPQVEWIAVVREREADYYRWLVEQGDDRTAPHERRAEARNFIEVMRWLNHHRRLQELAWFFARIKDLLFAQAHWNALLRYADLMASWAVSVGDPDTMRAVLGYPIDVCAFRNNQEQGHAWIDQAYDVFEQSRDALLRAEIAQARARLKFGSGLSLTTLHRQQGLQLDLRETSEIEHDLIDALATFKDAHLQWNVVQVLNALGLVARSRMDEDANALFQAKEYYTQAHDTIWRFAPYRPELLEWKPVVSSNLAIVAGREGRYAQSCKELEKVLPDLEEISGQAQVYAVLAYNYYQVHDEERAYSCRQEAEKRKDRLELYEDDYLCREDRLWHDREPHSR